MTPLLFALALAVAPEQPAIGNQCDMKANYADVIAATPEGTVTIHWRYRADSELASTVYGDTTCRDTFMGKVCEIRMRGDPPNVNDVCGLARLGHEAGHALGAQHEKVN